MSALLRVLAAIGVLVSVFLAPAAAEGPIEVRAVSFSGDGRTTTVVVETSSTAPVGVFVIADPTRFVIDLPATSFALPRDAGRTGGSIVASWRFGEFASGRARMIFDTAAPVRVVRAEWVPTTFFGNDRLVVELAASTREEMRDARPLAVHPGSTAISEPAADTAAALDHAPAVKADRAAVAQPAAPAVRRPVVVIDPGHGGLDAGTVSPASGTPEKSVVLALSRLLVERLRASGRYEVVTTRTEDVFIPLGERTKIARIAHADLFLSIHADAEYDHSVRGATVYTLAETPSDEKAAALAVKENQSDALGGKAVDTSQDVVADILADLTLRETRRFSNAFARDILDEYRRWGRLVKSMPHRQAGLRVLRAHDIPSALVEVGFLSNKEDEALMTSDAGRAHIVESLVTAIDHWFASHAPSGAAGPAETGSAALRTKSVGGGAAASP